MVKMTLHNDIAFQLQVWISNLLNDIHMVRIPFMEVMGDLLVNPAVLPLDTTMESCSAVEWMPIPLECAVHWQSKRIFGKLW